MDASSFANLLAIQFAIFPFRKATIFRLLEREWNWLAQLPNSESFRNTGFGPPHSRRLAAGSNVECAEICAAEYVRMSTEHQRYSIENQKVAIAAYAARHKIRIVRSYIDPGRSGLRIEHREALRQLIEDVQNGQANFSTILVYDVSRWGTISGYRRERLLRIPLQERGCAHSVLRRTVRKQRYADCSGR